MKYTVKFNDFLFDKLLEKSNNMLYFVLSDRLHNLLDSINHPISKEIVKMNDDYDILSDITLIDYHEENHNLFTFTMSNKLYSDYEKISDKEPDFIKWKIRMDANNYEGGLWDKYRSSIRIGRFINRLFPNKYPESGKTGEDIQSFIDNVKSKRAGGDDLFRVVKGNDLVKYYNQKSYSLEKGESGQLHNSCMKYDKCGEYMDFYVKNNIEMVILMSNIEKDKITGRAILWKLSEPDRYFMDRIYCIYDYDMEKFKDYAIKNNWLYKKLQNRNPYEYICDPDTNKCSEKVLKVENIKPSDKYPYLDTLSFFYKDNGILSNNEELGSEDDTEKPFYLQSTEGGYTVDGMVWSNYYDRLVDPDDLIYCEFGDSERLFDDCIYVETDDVYATIEYTKEHLKKSKLMNGKYINPDSENAVYLKKYDDWVTSWYIDSELFYNRIDDDFLLVDDAIWSDYHGTYIPKEKGFAIISKKDNEIYVDYAHEKYKNRFIKIITKDGEVKYFNLPDKEIEKLNI